MARRWRMPRVRSRGWSRLFLGLELNSGLPEAVDACLAWATERRRGGLVFSPPDVVYDCPPHAFTPVIPPVGRSYRGPS